MKLKDKYIEAMGLNLSEYERDFPVVITLDKTEGRYIVVEDTDLQKPIPIKIAWSDAVKLASWIIQLNSGGGK